jgi:PHP family Zn ribbon phosphoesterase
MHTVLSPCAAVEMIPPLIIQTALEKGINLIAITDHNSTANIQVVQQAAQRSGIVVLPGIEVQSREEIHSICLFDSLDQAIAFQKEVDDAMPEIANRPDFFGEQYIVDSTGKFLHSENRLLITSIALSLREIWDKVKDLGGMLIPAHIDRSAYGLLPVLGFLPNGIPFEVLEVSRHLSIVKARQQFPQLRAIPLIHNSDAHQLQDIRGCTEFNVIAPSIKEMQRALQKKNQRFFCDSNEN